jgi:hypothetical protein
MAPFLLPSVLALLAAFPAAPSLDPPDGMVEAPWVVNRVSADGRTLVLWARRGGCDPAPSATVTETPGSVEIHVRHATPECGGPCPALRFDRLHVRLKRSISGRALIGQSLEQAPPAVRVPRMVQLDAKDARFALRAQGLRPTGIHSGAITWETPWPGSAVRGTRPTEVYLSNSVPEPRPAVLGRLRFHTVAQGDGAASSLLRRAGLVVDGEARWKRIWRELTGSDRGRPRVDFERRRLLVAVQGRKPSGGHQVRITRVDGPPNGIVVKVREVSPGSGCITAGVLTSPYHVVSIPRFNRRVDFIRTQRVVDCR